MVIFSSDHRLWWLCPVMTSSDDECQSGRPLRARRSRTTPSSTWSPTLCCPSWAQSVRLVLSCLVLSCLVLSFLVLSCPVLSFVLLSCVVLSCIAFSCVVLPCALSLFLVLYCITTACLLFISSLLMSSLLVLSHLVSSPLVLFLSSSLVLPSLHGKILINKFK